MSKESRKEIQNLGELIDELEQEVYRRKDAGREINGCFAFIGLWLGDIKLHRGAKDDRFYSAFNTLYGFLWGLQASFFITAKEFRTLTDELNGFCQWEVFE